MRLSRRVIKGGIVTAALAFTTVATTVPGNAAETVQISSQTVSEDIRLNTDTDDKVLREQEIGSDVEWDKILLTNVEKNTFLNVREKADKKSKVVGKLYRGSGATVEKKGKNWSKIVSGDVKGYVYNEYCVFGDEAKEFAEEACDTQITVTENGLRVRKESNTNSGILGVLKKGAQLTVDESAEEVEGWVSVNYKGRLAYVSADYVEVGYKIDEAVSVNAQTKKSASVNASADDVTLLAAIIQCEAGGEPYSGKLAVGAVVMNRVKSGSFPNSISGVIYQRGQFSPAGSGKLSRVLSSGSISSSCYEAAREALSGVDNTGGAKYFHAGTGGKGTVIGHQIFY